MVTVGGGEAEMRSSKHDGSALPAATKSANSCCPLASPELELGIVLGVRVIIRVRARVSVRVRCFVVTGGPTWALRLRCRRRG